MTIELGGNPFAPYEHHPKAPPTENARLPVQRLKAAGAPASVVAEAERRWSTAAPVERQEAREAFDALTDEELADQVVDMEFGLALQAAGIENLPNDPDLFTDPRALLEAALEVNAGTVDAARQWVEESTDGHPSDRALAMLVAERRRAETEQRKTLIEPLEARVRGD